MERYVDFDFYTDRYLMGRPGVIPEQDFPYWSMQATSKMRSCTFGRADILEPLPEPVLMCCCEVAEKLYLFDAAKTDNGMVLRSYENDGETATFESAEFTAEAVTKAVSDIIEKWLSNTGLMYCGVE